MLRYIIGLKKDCKNLDKNRPNFSKIDSSSCRNKKTYATGFCSPGLWSVKFYVLRKFICANICSNA